VSYGLARDAAGADEHGTLEPPVPTTAVTRTEELLVVQEDHLAPERRRDAREHLRDVVAMKVFEFAIVCDASIAMRGHDVRFRR
jgi:hypothetical protein